MRAELTQSSGYIRARASRPKLCVGPDGAETFLLVRSAERQQKERARMYPELCVSSARIVCLTASAR